MTLPVTNEWLEIQTSDAEAGMEVFLARPDQTGSWPAVLVFMEIFGVNTHICDVAKRLAAHGYVALAINYYHRTTKNLELGYSEQDVETGRQHKDQTTREGILEDVSAAIAYLQSREDVDPKDKMGTIGFCFGGHVGYIAASLPQIVATASFYGGGIANASPGGGAPTISHTPQIHGKMVMLFGEQDPLIPHSHTVEIEKALQFANIPHQVVRYPEAGHGFFCNQRSDFSPFCASDAWERVMDLFDAELKELTS